MEITLFLYISFNNIDSAAILAKLLVTQYFYCKSLYTAIIAL